MSTRWSTSSSSSLPGCANSWDALLPPRTRGFERLFERRKLLDSPNLSTLEADQASERVLNPRVGVASLEPTRLLPLHGHNLVTGIDYLDGFHTKLSVEVGP